MIELLNFFINPNKHIMKTVKFLSLALVCSIVFISCKNETAAEQNGDLGALIVNMSSILGSVELNNPKSGGGVYPYRSSKTALNMITRSLSLDLRHMNIKVVAIHPGWVKTDMGGKNAPLTTEQSIAGVLNVIRNFDTEHYNGQLIDYKGDVLPF